MEYALNVKMNSILENIVLIYVINAQMVSAILMASVMIKLQIVNIIIIMGLNAITSVIQNVINVIEMELAQLALISIIGVLTVINNVLIAQEKHAVQMEPVQMKIQNVKIRYIMEKNVIQNAIQNVLSVIEMENVLHVQIIIIGVLNAKVNAKIAQIKFVNLMENVQIMIQNFVEIKLIMV